MNSQNMSSPLSPIDRKGIQTVLNYQTPKTQYKSVEKHAIELMNTPKPSSKKKNIFSNLDSNEEELSNFNLFEPQQLHFYKKLSSIQENQEDDKENNCNTLNQHSSQLFNQSIIDQIIINVSDLNNYACNFQQTANLKDSNKLIDFFYYFNQKNEYIQNIFSFNAQFEIINSGMSTNLQENIIKLNQTFNSFQIDQQSITIEQFIDSTIVNIRGNAFGNQCNVAGFIASAKISCANNQITHLKIQFV